LKKNCVQKERTQDTSHSEDTACAEGDEKNECHSADIECPDGKDKKLGIIMKKMSGHMRRTKHNSCNESPFSEESLITVVSTYSHPRY